MVTLKGQVDDDDSRDEITDVVKRVEGVRLVMNQMNTDDEVMTAWQFAARELGEIGDYFRRNWLLMILAVGFRRALGAPGTAVRRQIRDDTGPVRPERAVAVGDRLGHQLAARHRWPDAGARALRLTHLVLSIVGVASIVGLAVGFAFRDITENFIASVLLGYAGHSRSAITSPSPARRAWCSR